MLLLPESLTLRDARDVMRLLKVSLERESESVLVIEGSSLRRFDSSAIAVLLECRRLAQAWGKQFELRGLPPQLVELARLYGVLPLLEQAVPAVTPA
jgi:phospholipid transport system transporter-binding protein